jgi:hypothetical protein
MTDTNDRTRLWRDFIVFANAQLLTKDIDPAYPVLKARFDLDECSEETRLWRLILYLTYYSLSSAEKAWAHCPEFLEFTRGARLPALPTGIERRGMRGNPEAVNRFLESVRERVSGCGGAPRRNDSLVAWVRAVLPVESPRYRPESGWRAIRDQVAECWGVGPWASYKWADLLKHVGGYNITANDIGLGGGSKTAGPVPGLALLSGQTPDYVATHEHFQREWFDRAREAGARFGGLDQFETALCDFNSLVKGTYYVGHDIDLMQETLEPDSPFFAARAAALPSDTLGEVGGWKGVSKFAKAVYRDSGNVITSQYVSYGQSTRIFKSEFIEFHGENV